MTTWWDRLVAHSDVARAKRAAWIAGSFIVVLLYALGALSLYVRKTMMSPADMPTPTVASLVAPPTEEPEAPVEPTSEPPTVAPSAAPTNTPTLFPTLTPTATP
ncbi:MAG: hypothetical protein GXY68_08890 [Chloroflexi bacterium]|jgi:cytoskeletal protein RodZ|nr:hypothetical protein [Chloroflexota bacterium]